ncbi:plant cysteine oxidase 1-like isoform X2 [Tasmannia lanceolata]|uniref:plant cysteine oxidase 1-like isoform X2 n=1 Tax=Tasmannia lanceolata TaxID=3420 RepID=UPI004063E03A
MMIETDLIEQKEQKLCELPTEKRSKKNKRKKRKAMPNNVQNLFAMCKEIFSQCGPGIVPPPADVERLRSVLDTMNASDVGLNQDMRYFRRTEIDGAPRIGIFCLPTSAVIPLHNHPGMTVFSKLLFGTMHIKSYDWDDMPLNPNGTPNPSQSQLSGVRLAKVKIDATFTAPCKTSILYPTAGGNMHRFTAVEPCAVLDVLGPPYCDPEGRHCTYYLDVPYSSSSDSGDGAEENLGSGVGGEGEELGYAWLQEKHKSDFYLIGAKYGGPKIVEN